MISTILSSCQTIVNKNAKSIKGDRKYQVIAFKVNMDMTINMDDVFTFTCYKI